MKLGYTNVKVYAKGLPDWIRRRYPVIRMVNYPKVRIPLIQPSEVLKKLDELTILDIGGDELKKIGQFKRGNVIHIPMDDLEDDYERLPKDKTLVITDVMGKQEQIAGRFLWMKGYRKLLAMKGGGRAWFDTVRVLERIKAEEAPEEEKTLKKEEKRVKEKIGGEPKEKKPKRSAPW